MGLNIDDYQNEETWISAVRGIQVSENGATRTSASKSTTQPAGLTTYTVSNVMQGMTFYKPKGATLDLFNQTLSKDLEGLKSEADPKFGYKEKTQLSPYDIFTGAPSKNPLSSLVTNTQTAVTAQVDNTVPPAPGVPAPPEVPTGSSSGAKIAAAAIHFAWPDKRDGQKSKAQAKPEYQDAMPRLNGSTGHDEWSDCGVFVATCVAQAGVDPSFPKRLTTTIMAYMRAHPEKYDMVENVTSTAQLQPGDIIVNVHHIMIFVGKQSPNDQWDTRDASQGERVPGTKTYAPYPEALKKPGAPASEYTYCAGRIK